MLYMVIERFRDARAVYRRLSERGRMMPEGLNYVFSWIDYDVKRCWQVMETDDATLFDRWTANWSDLVEFEIIPVRTSAETATFVRRSDQGLS